MADPVVIRASSLTMYPDCKGRSAARLFRKEIEAAGFELRETPRGVGSAIGSAVHKAASVILNEKALTGELPPASVATDCADGELNEIISQGIRYDGPKGITQTLREASRQTTSMTLIYRRRVAPLLNPILIEERLEADFLPGIILSGQSDVVAREPNAVVDLKTSGKKGFGSHAPQLGAYALLARTPTERHPNGLQIDEVGITQLQRVRPDKPQPDPIHRRLNVANAETAATKILTEMATDLATFRNGDVKRRILPGDHWAFIKNPNSMLCKANFCPAYGVRGERAFCHEWESKENS